MMPLDWLCVTCDGNERFYFDQELQLNKLGWLLYASFELSSKSF